MVKTAIIGASGFIGRHLLAAYRREYPDCVGTCFSNSTEGLVSFDVRRPVLSELRLEESGHRAVIVAAAKPLIGYCEQHKEEAYAVNVSGTLELARQLAETSLQVIFLSSDYVFEGTDGPYGDRSPTNPTTEYGRHKQAVEQALPGLVDNHLILRLAKTYGLEKGDGTLLDEMAESLRAGRTIRAASDQFFCPTWVRDLVMAVQWVQERGARGTFNLCAAEGCSRHQLARRLCDQLGIDSALVEEISLYDIPSMRGRPLDTRMTCEKLQEFPFLSLEEAMTRMAAAWRPS